jgi:biopolymer transport protein ExbB
VTDLRAHWLSLVDSGHALLDFMTAGGVVMWALAGLCVLYWTLVFERLWFMRRVFPHWVESRRQAWAQMADEPGSWQRAVRSAWLAQAQQQLSGPLRLSKTLVAMYPLLGLLGTVSGMIAVFDVLALSGSGNPRGMAARVWQATLPTMAGMVLAITGLFSLARLERIARQSLDRLADQLRHD